MDPNTLANKAKSLALEIGFDLVGIANADAPRELNFFAEWISRGYAGDMAYLTSQVSSRSALRTAFPWARSVISVALQYDTPQPYSTTSSQDRGWISRYAWGDDYHHVMKILLDGLAAALLQETGPFQFRTYVDTGPIVERAYAAAAGIGAWGKNTCLLHPEHGSWFFLGEIIVDLDLSPDTPRTDMCGSCTACLEACPTGALPAPYVLDATRCISYLTIELKETIPVERRDGLGQHLFGCDICQDVCPWNRKRKHRGRQEFEARDGLVAPDLQELAELTEVDFRERFRKSPLKRTKRRGLLRNVAVAMGNRGDAAYRPVLTRLSEDLDPIVREHALWAIERLPKPS